MCGIVGVFNNENAAANVKAGLKIIKERGRDCYGIANEKDIDYKKDINKLRVYRSNNCIGHCLHSIVSFVPQPFFNKRTGAKFIANCEIYNWKELNKKYRLNARNDSELLFNIVEKKGKGANKLKELLEEIDGVYAFAYWNKNKVYLARDILGVKPLCFSATQDCFAFSSEKKALEALDYKNSMELNPRKILVYNLKNRKARQYSRKFFSITPETKDTMQGIIKKLEGLTLNAVSKRIPDDKFGILFSGGIDSTYIALVCKKLGLSPTLYTAVLECRGIKAAEDLIWARKAAKALGLRLRVNKIRLYDVEKYIKKVIQLIEDANVVKVGVGITFYAACELAKKDSIRVIFSGLGSEEIFAGYERHKTAGKQIAGKDSGISKVNMECLSGLLNMHERDLYRDDIITMNNSIELRLPFLDKRLVDYALKIPAGYKLNGQQNRIMQQNKVILRETAKYLGLDSDFAERKKKAAQYGSKFDKAIEKLAKKNGFKLKSEYLKQFRREDREENLKLGVLFSSGKDSNYALYIMKEQGYDIKCLIVVRSINKASYMFHTPNIGIAKLQAEAIGIPVLERTTKGEKERELKDLEDAIKKAKEKYRLNGIVTGALYSTYQRDRIGKICSRLGLKMFSPLWHIDQEQELRQLIRKGFKVMLSSVQAEGLDSSWLGRELTEKDVDKLVQLNKKIGINIAGEGGEFESMVVDGPLYKKKIKIIASEIIEEKENVAFFVVKKAELVEK